MDLFDGLAFFLTFAIVLPLGLLALVVLVLAGGRDVDPTGKRTVALYVATVSFVALFTALVASTGIVGSLTEKIKDNESSSSFEDDVFSGDVFDEFDDFNVDSDSDVSENDRLLRGVVQSALLLVVAGGVLVFHHRRRREYTAERGFEGSAAWRTDRAYVYAACFTAVLIFLFSTATGSYNIFKLIGPSVFGSGDNADIRKAALQDLLTLGWLALASAGIFHYYWSRGGSGPDAIPRTSPPAPRAPAAKEAPAKKAAVKKAPAKKR